MIFMLHKKISAYKKKRDFMKTSEPKGSVGAARLRQIGELSETFCETVKKKFSIPKARPIYVIQEHHSSRLHWDLRLEKDGGLKSWALPKTPLLKEGERRLAIETEEHPLEYANFSGKIPEGNYGAGSVKIFDSGTFTVEKFSEKEIVVDIKGKKLSGKFVLIKFRPAEKNWLFFRKKA